MATTTTRFDTYRGRLTQAAERASPDQATHALILAGELRAAHKQAIAERDARAAALHYHHGWTFTALCVAMHGRPNKVAAVRTAVEKTRPARRLSKSRAEESFRQAQQDVQELWTLYKEAKELEKRANDGGPGPDVVLDLPGDAPQRAVAAAEQLYAVDAEYRAAVELRNRAAAALIVHANWPKRSAAALAKAAVRDLYPHEKTAPKPEADPQLVAERAEEARRLAERKAALVRARDQTIRALSKSMGPAEIARLVKLTDERVVQIRDGA